MLNRGLVGGIDNDFSYLDVARATGSVKDVVSDIVRDLEQVLVRAREVEERKVGIPVNQYPCRLN